MKDYQITNTEAWKEIQKKISDNCEEIKKASGKKVAALLIAQDNLLNKRDSIYNKLSEERA